MGGNIISNILSGGIVIAVIIFLILFFSFVPVGLWITAYFSGVKIKISTLIGMKLRRVSPRRIVIPMIKATKAGLDLMIENLEAHYLAGGNVNTLVDALIAAERANIDLNFQQAAAMNLAGRNVFEAVQVSVNPKVINTPTIAAVAKNGIEVKVIAKVTVRANIERLVGALADIARIYKKDKTGMLSGEFISPIVEKSPQEAFYADKESLPIKDTKGRISGEFVMCYPPGIPILAPGEMITEEIIEYILYVKEKGCSMQGTEDPMVNNLMVLKNTF